MPGDGRRTRRRLVLGTLTVVIVVWAGAAAALLLAARSDVNDGVDALRAARADLSPLSVLEPDSLTEVRDAEARFSSARGRLRSVVVSPLRILPVVGRQIRALDGMTGAAASILDLGGDAVERVRAGLREVEDGGPETRVDFLTGLSQLSGDIAAHIRAVDLGPSEALVGPLARARNEMVEEIVELHHLAATTSASASGAAELLKGPRRYLVLAAHNGEMRAGSGMFLVAATLEVSDGRFSLSAVQRTADLYLPEGEQVGGDLEAIWGWLHPGREWRNLGVSPRFDVTAELASRMWERAGNDPVDGVIALDIIALRELLEATGPVTVDGQRIDADSLLDDLLVKQYEAAGAAERRDRLGDIAIAVFGRVNDGRVGTAALAESLADAASGRHILVWSKRPESQAAWKAAGVDGAMEPESMLVSIVSRGGNKLDSFLRVSGRIDTDADPDAGGTRVRVRLSIRNTATPALPPYVAGPHPSGKTVAGEYHGIVALSAPFGASSFSVDGGGDRAVAGHDSPNEVLGVFVRIPQGESTEVEFAFTLPGSSGGMVVEPSARHPRVRWDYAELRWTDSREMRVTWGA